MPLIKPRTRGKQMVRHITRLDRENHETLYAYAQFLGEPTEYVLNQLIDTVLAKDKEFVKWRAEHPGRIVPRADAPVTRAEWRTPAHGPSSREAVPKVSVRRSPAPRQPVRVERRSTDAASHRPSARWCSP